MFECCILHCVAWCELIALHETAFASEVPNNAITSRNATEYGTKCSNATEMDCMHWAIPFNMHTPPSDDMICLSQGVIQTSTVLGGTVSHFVVSRGVNSIVLGGKLLR